VNNRSVGIAMLAVVVAGTITGVGVVAVGGVRTAGGHGTHVSVGPQVVDGSRVVVEAANTAQDGFLVLHAEDGGRPGEPIGNTPLSSGFHDDLTVELRETGAIPRDGEHVLWAVVHRDDGDGRFTPAADPPVESLGGIAGGQFAVRAGDRPVYALTHDVNAQPSNGTVRIARVATAERGYLVVHTDDRGQLGPAIGNVSLSTGLHRSVTVDLNGSVFADQRDYFRLWAVVYADDGDGRFTPADEPVSVGGEPVRTRFPVQTVDRVPASWRANGSGGSTTAGTGAGTEATSNGDATTSTHGGPIGDGGIFGPGFAEVVAAAAVALVVVVLLWRSLG
jgi:hypothetical protein